MYRKQGKKQKAALDIARAVTAKLWYKVIKGISENKTNAHYFRLRWWKVLNTELISDM